MTTTEPRFWSKKYGVSPNELRCAVSKVGVLADDVARELGILEVSATIKYPKTLQLRVVNWESRAGDCAVRVLAAPGAMALHRVERLIRCDYREAMMNNRSNANDPDRRHLRHCVVCPGRRMSGW